MWGDPPHVTSPIWGPPPPCKQALDSEMLACVRELRADSSRAHPEKISRKNGQ